MVTDSFAIQDYSVGHLIIGRLSSGRKVLIQPGNILVMFGGMVWRSVLLFVLVVDG